MKKSPRPDHFNPANQEQFSIEEPTEDDLIEAEATPRSTMGLATFGIDLPIALSQYDRPKVTLHLEEPYSGIGEDTRDNKVNELMEYILNKFDETLPSIVDGIKELKSNNEPKK